jgi:hypothetical protein
VWAPTRTVFRWSHQSNSNPLQGRPGFPEHCHQFGAGGIQRSSAIGSPSSLPGFAPRWNPGTCIWKARLVCRETKPMFNVLSQGARPQKLLERRSFEV